MSIEDPTNRFAITNRFVDIYYQLYRDRVVANKKDFCERINLNPSSFSQMEKGNVHCSIRTICEAVKEYNVNPLWLLMADGETFNR